MRICRKPLLQRDRGRENGRRDCHGYRNALRSFGIRIKPGGTRCFGDNLGQVQNSSMTTSPLKERRTSMAWHMERWSQAIGACGFGKVNGNDSPSDFVRKGTHGG